MTPDWLPDLSKLTESLGTEVFKDNLLIFLNRLLPVDHIAIFTFDPTGRAAHLFTQSRLNSSEVQSLTDAYMGGGYAADPNVPRATETRYAELIGKGIHNQYDNDYLKQFFGESGLVDKVSTAMPADNRPDAPTVYCNFYRLKDSGCFSPEDWTQLQALLPLVTHLIVAHRRLLPAAETSTQSLIHSIISRSAPPFDRLTPREREVCARVLMGYSSEAIAIDLGIAPSSVATYRKRAYEKLRITGQSELFSLCLSASS